VIVGETNAKARMNDIDRLRPLFLTRALTNRLLPTHDVAFRA